MRTPDDNRRGAFAPAGDPVSPYDKPVPGAPRALRVLAAGEVRNPGVALADEHGVAPGDHAAPRNIMQELNAAADTPELVEPVVPVAAAAPAVEQAAPGTPVIEAGMAPMGFATPQDLDRAVAHAAPALGVAARRNARFHGAAAAVAVNLLDRFAQAAVESPVRPTRGRFRFTDAAESAELSPRTPPRKRGREDEDDDDNRAVRGRIEDENSPTRARFESLFDRLLRERRERRDEDRSPRR